MTPLQSEGELARLRASPHGVATTTNLLKPPLRLVDGPSFAAQYADIFIRESYDFPCPSSAPVIVDGGANVGAATIWWRARWPAARIIAFEPDPHIFEVLTWNTRFLDGIELRQCALVGRERLMFWAEGTDAGRLAPDGEGELISVPTVTLSEVLAGLGAVDLLKLDIEGAESDVLEEAEDALGLARRIFVEYHSLVRREQTLSQLLGLLQRQGFRYYLESPGQRLRPFHGVPVDRGIDFQCNIFAWRGRDGE